MELHEVDVFIDPDGQVCIEVRGIKGGACLDLTAPLEATLGAEVVERELTPEAGGTLAEAERRVVREA